MAGCGSVKVDGLEDFRKKLEENLSEEEIQLFMEQCAKELAARLLTKCIKRTPVGVRPKITGKKFTVVKGASGKKQKFLSAEAARYEKYWAGYSGGTLRRGWTAKTHEEAKSGGGNGTPVAEFVSGLNVNHAGEAYTIEIINPVEYAPYIEYGHRQTVGRYVPAIGKKLKKGWVEGKFMLTKSAEEIQRDAPRILEQKLKRKLGECIK